MSGFFRQVVVVVTGRADLRDRDAVTAEEFLEGGKRSGKPRTTVVNLCRSVRYLSRGYYVSLLADARGQRVFPTIETLRALADAEGVRRRLEEEDVATLDAVGRRARRDVAVVFGKTVSGEHARAASALFRVIPAPLLTVRFAQDDDGDWKVVHVEPLSVTRLKAPEKRLLAEELDRLRDPDWRPPAKAEGKRIAIAVLHDEDDPFAPSTEETIDKLERVASHKDVLVHRITLGEIGRLGDFDALFIRTLTGLNEPSYRFAVRAAALGKPVIDDPQSTIRCSNKVFLHEAMAREDIPTPKTLVISPATARTKIERALGYPFILKQPDGSFSTAVHKVATPKEFRERAKRMFRASPLLIAQAWTPSDFDWRVTTLGGKPLFVCKYHMARGHWQIRSAGRKGVRYGKVEAVPREYAPRDVVRLACRASKIVGDGLYGVDIKPTKAGPVVIEVNDNPNVDVGYDDAADGVRIYEDLVDHFVARVRAEHRPKPKRAPRREEPDPILAAIRRPIGKAPRAPRGDYRAFEVCGLELEYPIVDRDLNVAHLVEPLLAALAGHPASDVALGAVGFSNEIFDHVFEAKTMAPAKSLADAETWLAEGVRRVCAVLEDHFDARLLPTGMHPWFDPKRARLWERSDAKIYRTYERLFPVRTHGWANVQAVHVNLPMGRDHEAAAMMTAAALLVPYLPAVAASTPVWDGSLHDVVDGRMSFVCDHQERVPETSGDVVPEYCTSPAQYRRDVLGPMYAAVDRLPNARVLRNEFLNCRGAVFKFSRSSMEVRALDMQECVKMDVALAVFVRSVLKSLTQSVLDRDGPLPDHALLVEDLHATIAYGTKARVHAPHLAPNARRGRDRKIDARAALRDLLDRARAAVRPDEDPYLYLVDRIVERGSLGERIRAALLPHARDDDAFTDAARRLYVDLTECLRDNVPWSGR